MDRSEIMKRDPGKERKEREYPMPQEKRPTDRILTVPNAMSALRILLVPFFAALYLRGHVAWAVALLVLSGITDMLDGLIARRFNQITDLGKMLDPFADKLTQGVVALCIAIRFSSIRPLLALFILKELLMLSCAQAYMRGQVVRQGGDGDVLCVRVGHRAAGRPGNNGAGQAEYSGIRHAGAHRADDGLCGGEVFPDIPGHTEGAGGEEVV